MSKIKVALAQIAPVFANVKANIEKSLEYARKAINEGAQLVVFPELMLSGYTLQDLALPLSIKDDSPILEPLLKLSKEIAIVTSYPRLCPDNICRISAAFLDDGKIVSIYDKICPPTHGMFDEMRYFGRGEKLQAFDTRFGRVGLLVCRDLWHPELSYVYSLQNAQMIIAPSAIPARNLTEGGFTISGSLQKSVFGIANANQLFAMVCNRVGVEDGVTFLGNSAVYAPSGRAMLELPEVDEKLGLVEVDLAEIAMARAKVSLVRERRNDIVRKELERLV